MKDAIRTISLMSVAAIAAAAFADRTPPAGTATLYGDWSIQQGIFTSTAVWTNSTDSTRIAWTQDSYGIVQNMWKSGNFSLNGLHFWGMKWDLSAKRWLTMRENVWFGSGGLELPKSSATLSFGDSAGAQGHQVYLTSSQTWNGPESGSANVTFGHDNYGDAYKLIVNGTSCPEWTLEKGLNLWITWANNFATTDITVEYPARIWLEKKWTTSNVAYEGSPALGAKTLTLSGDGTMWEAGGKSTVSNGYKIPDELEPEMNSTTVTPSLTLNNGADLLGRSAGWDIPTLSVTGTGESSFNGTWTFRRSVTDVSIASGSVLALAGDVKDGDVPAGLNVTGFGTLKLDPSTFRLTGDLTLGADVTLVLAGHGEFSHRIDGGKEIRIESDGADVAHAISLRASALVGFTGSRVVIASGKAIVDDKAGVTVVEDGGARIDVSAAFGDPWVVTDAVREEASITVGSGETLYVLGNGLTAATSLTLNGGRVAFMRSAAVSSPVTVTDTSSIGAESISVVGLMLGRIEGACESNKELRLDSSGTVNLAGGGSFSEVSVYVTKGSANLMSNRFEFAYCNLGVYEGDYLGIRDGAHFEGVYPRTGGIYGITSRPVYGGKSLVEICANSTVKFNQNVTTFLGRGGSEGAFRISGGTLTVSHGSRLNIGYNGSGIGLFEINDGLFVTDQSFMTGNQAGTRGRVVWRGGRIKLGSDFWTYAGNGSRCFDGSSSNLTFTIAGPDCVLDLNGAPAFTNVVANSLNEGSWQWEEGGRLTVTNGGVFVMNRFPENGRVAVKDCNLLIADESEPDIGELGFAGTPSDTIAGADGLTLAAQGVRVLSGGEWSAAQVDGISWSDLTLDSGSIIRMEMTSSSAVGVCSVPGLLTLGDELGFRLVRNGYRLSAPRITTMTATGGVSGNPVFTSVEKLRGATMGVSGNLVELLYDPDGMTLIFR